MDILSLFPKYFKTPFEQSIVARAVERGLLELNFVDIRDFAYDKHKQVDDKSYGGGPGMVLKAQPVVDAIKKYRKNKRTREKEH